MFKKVSKEEPKPVSAAPVVAQVPEEPKQEEKEEEVTEDDIVEAVSHLVETQASHEARLQAVEAMLFRLKQV